MNEQLQRFWIRVTVDRRNFGFMCVLLAVGLLLWGRLILLESVPRVGFADPDAATTAGPQSAADQAGLDVAHELPIVYMDLPRGLQRNLFLAPSSFLPQPAQDSSASSLEPKSQAETSEDPIALQQQRIERIRQDGASLRLESLIHGTPPIAVVDGHVLRIGQVIQGFRLEAVGDRSVVLMKDGVRVELVMDVPGSRP